MREYDSKEVSLYQLYLQYMHVNHSHIYRSGSSAPFLIYYNHISTNFYIFIYEDQVLGNLRKVKFQKTSKQFAVTFDAFLVTNFSKVRKRAHQ